LRALSLVLGREFRLQYLAVASLQKNIWIDTCDAEMVLRFGFVKLGRYPFAATEGSYTCTVTGSISAVVPAQSVFRSDDSSQSPGFLFILDNAHTMTGTTDTITLRALTAGTISRLSVGNTLTATQPFINVNSNATVTAESTIPNDAETIEQYRAKALASYQLLPSGDNAISYREEGSLNVNGVQQIYPYATLAAPNEIDIYIEAIPADSTDGKGTPTATIITDVTTAIEDSRPLGVHLVHYYPITLKQVDVNINMFGYPALTADQTSLILTAVNLFMSTVRPFIANADTIANRNDILASFNLIPVVARAIPGVGFGAVTIKVATVPVTSYQFDNGEIPWLNAVTYV
jgi:hypothetical protein